MKSLMIAILMTSFLSTIAFASPLLTESEGEASTDCQMMKETNERENPKLNLSSITTQTIKPKTGSTAQ